MTWCARTCTMETIFELPWKSVSYSYTRSFYTTSIISFTNDCILAEPKTHLPTRRDSSRAGEEDKYSATSCYTAHEKHECFRLQSKKVVIIVGSIIIGSSVGWFVKIPFFINNFFCINKLIKCMNEWIIHLKSF